MDWKIVSICLAYVLTCLPSRVVSEGNDSIIGARPLYSNRPFVVIWSKPTNKCPKEMHKDLKKKWGIVVNKSGHINGDRYNLLYQPGKWPFYEHWNRKKPINGGLPQEGNRTAHVLALQKAISKKISNQSYYGPAIIDWEDWRPVYHTNFGKLNVYRLKSRDIVQSKHPRWTAGELNAEAERQFEKYARFFFNESLQTAKTMRPGGSWGYYLFPRLYGWALRTTVDVNDRLSWLYKESSGFYPSMYWGVWRTPRQNSAFIRKTMLEALRVRAKYNTDPDTPVIPYCLDHSSAFELHNESYLDISIGKPADMGASGVILWGSWANMLNNFKKDRCESIRNHINQVLGPYVKELSEFHRNCARKLCSGQGRCVRRDYDAALKEYMGEGFEDRAENAHWGNNQFVESDGELQVKPKRKMEDFQCQCYSGFSGKDCQTHINYPLPFEKML